VPRHQHRQVRRRRHGVVVHLQRKKKKTASSSGLARHVASSLPACALGRARAHSTRLPVHGHECGVRWTEERGRVASLPPGTAHVNRTHERSGTRGGREQWQRSGSTRGEQ
jgi:hypothetical protein